LQRDRPASRTGPPDGRYLAYITLAPNSVAPGTLHIHDTSTGADRAVRTGLGQVFGPRWSPDGRFLAVTGMKDRHRVLAQVDVQSGETTILVRHGRGEWVQAYQWTLAGDIVFHRFTGGDECALVRFTPATGEQATIYQGPFIHAFAVSPNGQWLAFTPRSATESALWVMPAAGGEARDLVKLNEPRLLEAEGAVAWSPDAHSVLFAKRDRADSADYSLWRVPLAGGDAEPAGLTTERLRHLGVDRSGQRLAFTGGSRADEVWVMENFLPKEQDTSR
jgi:Tol biopolymer transport system component